MNDGDKWRLYDGAEKRKEEKSSSNNNFKIKIE